MPSDPIASARLPVPGRPRADDDMAPGSPDPARPNAWWVVHDGGCAMCARLVRVLARLDAEGRFVAVAGDDPRVAAQLPWLDRDALDRALQVVAPDGRTWEAAAAVEVIVARLPRSRWLAPLFAVPGVRDLAERIYRVVARNRHRLGCGAHCAERERGDAPAGISPRHAPS